jgi:Zn-dependent protease
VSAAPNTAPAACPCGTEVSTSLLVCPSCRRLVHAEALKELASRAEAARAQGDSGAALALWRSSLGLLPPNSRQFAAVAERVAALSRDADARVRDAGPGSGRWKWLAALGPAGLLAWKFKFVVVALLSKGKLLVFGLTKISTVASMLAALGLYWTQWGLWFASGLVLSIYVHEMGHVAALRRYGIAASAPMFIPGFGAMIRVKQMHFSPRENARIGMAGPLWGLGAAAAALAAFSLGGGQMWGAIARTGAWINLFNLMPVWQLDGSRAFASMTASHRWLAAAAAGGAWAITGDGLVLLVLIVAILRALSGGADAPEDRGALVLYGGSALALAVVFRAAS